MNLIFVFLFVFTSPGDKIKITDPWMRPGAENMASALYFNINNNGETADTLYKIETDIAGGVELHETYSNGDVIGMRQVEMIVVQPGSSFQLKPGAHHIMLMKLKLDIKEGDEHEFILYFKQAGKLKISATAKMSAK